jgi:hypothetical protein
MHVYGPEMHVSGIVPLALVPGRIRDVKGLVQNGFSHRGCEVVLCTLIILLLRGSLGFGNSCRLHVTRSVESACLALDNRTPYYPGSCAALLTWSRV